MYSLRNAVLEEYKEGNIVPVILTFKDGGYMKSMLIKISLLTAAWFLEEFPDATNNLRVERYVHKATATQGENVLVYKNVTLKKSQYESGYYKAKKLVGAYEIKDGIFMPNMRVKEKYRKLI